MCVCMYVCVCVCICVCMCRSVQNSTGMDMFVPKFDTSQGAGRETLYHIIVISVMSVFKSPKHKPEDVVQFSVSFAQTACPTNQSSTVAFSAFRWSAIAGAAVWITWLALCYYSQTSLNRTHPFSTKMSGSAREPDNRTRLCRMHCVCCRSVTSYRKSP